MAKAAQHDSKKGNPWGNRAQVIGLIVLLFFLMTTSVVTSMIVAGVIDIFPPAGEPIHSMTDAQMRCDSEIRAEYGDKLQAFAIDDLSSRADEKRPGYKLFYELTMYRDVSHRSGVNKFYINCFVSASGRIRQMDLMEQKDYVPKAGRRTHGNPFGL